MSRRTGISAPCKVAKRTINVSLIIQSPVCGGGVVGGWGEQQANPNHSVNSITFLCVARQQRKDTLSDYTEPRTADSLLTVYSRATMVGNAAALVFPSQEKSIRLGMNSLERCANRLATGYSRTIGCGRFRHGRSQLKPRD